MIARVRGVIAAAMRSGSMLGPAGVGSLIHYPIPPHLQEAYADLKQGKGSYPLAEELAETVLSLPMGPQMELDTVDEVAAVVRATLS